MGNCQSCLDYTGAEDKDVTVFILIRNLMAPMVDKANEFCRFIGTLGLG